VYYSGNDDCWIGLYKSASDTSHYWLDGNNSTYRIWEGGKPGNEKCVRIKKNGKFKDESCASEYRYVCKGI